MNRVKTEIYLFKIWVRLHTRLFILDIKRVWKRVRTRFAIWMFTRHWGRLAKEYKNMASRSEKMAFAAENFGRTFTDVMEEYERERL
jgi:hypothetical protein